MPSRHTLIGMEEPLQIIAACYQLFWQGRNIGGGAGLRAADPILRSTKLARLCVGTASLGQQMNYPPITIDISSCTWPVNRLEHQHI